MAGSRARITDDLRPALLRGLTGTVQQRNRTGGRAGFILDEEFTRRRRTDPRNGERVKPPLSHLRGHQTLPVARQRPPPLPAWN
ncbi:hypothetical protein [Streptomyces sp. NPDC058678]|uniref:hypothetical protein n=1 Tax=Streptomyces sp. NPDC058678 TaxID=3346595 RepID=UPI00365B61A1